MMVGRAGKTVEGCGAVVNGQKECLHGDVRFECSSGME